MLGRDTYLKFVLIAMLVCLGFSSKALAETPRQQLEGTMEGVMEVTRTFQRATDMADNRDRLRKLILPRFDFVEMARTSLGSHWSSLKGRENEFLAAFIQFAEGSYMSALGSYRGERIIYGREWVSSNLAEVDTQVVDSRGETTPVNYRLHLVGGEWKVYDVVIDHVSLVSNYQSQFSRILRGASLDELLRKLREKREGAQS